MGERTSVAVLGAGVSGAIAARRLTEAGLAVTVFDKGRGVGGRMATRHVPDRDLAFDHGAQFMRARGGDFAERLSTWEARGVVGAWDGMDGFVGTPGMTAPIRDLLDGIDVRLRRTVTGIARRAEGWRLAIAEEADEALYDAVAMSFPAPQAAALLTASGIPLPGIERPAYAPCWSLMVACHRDHPIAAGPLSDDGGIVGQVFREDTKPGRSGDTVRLVVHAIPAWSRSHLEESPERVAQALTDAIAQRIGASVAPSYARAHRWRCALVEESLGEPCLYQPASRVGACGDGCLGPRIEAAYDSGAALAARIAADLA